MQNSIDTSLMYNDFQGLSALKLEAQKDPSASNHKVAQQFEALFIQTMLKSMREASHGDSLMDSDQTKLYQDMMDKQLSLNMSKAGGIGIADVIERQMNRGVNTDSEPDAGKTELSIKFATHLFTQTPTQAQHKPTLTLTKWNSPNEFIQSIQPYANKAADRLNTSPDLIVAISALETGWGKHMAQTDQGNSSFNLLLSISFKASKLCNRYSKCLGRMRWQSSIITTTKPTEVIDAFK